MRIDTKDFSSLPTTFFWHEEEKKGRRRKMCVRFVSTHSFIQHGEGRKKKNKCALSCDGGKKHHERYPYLNTKRPSPEYLSVSFHFSLSLQIVYLTINEIQQLKTVRLNEPIQSIIVPYISGNVFPSGRRVKLDFSSSKQADVRQRRRIAFEERDYPAAFGGVYFQGPFIIQAPIEVLVGLKGAIIMTCNKAGDGLSAIIGTSIEEPGKTDKGLRSTFFFIQQTREKRVQFNMKRKKCLTRGMVRSHLC